MTVNKRQKKRIDGYLFKYGLYHNADEAREIKEYLAHLEACVEAWQKMTEQKHPTLTEF